MRRGMTIVITSLALGLICGTALAQAGGPQPAPCIVFRGACDAPSLESVYMVDTSTGWAVTHGHNANELLRTTDGGNTWRDVTPVGSLGGDARVREVAVLTSFVAWASSEASERASRIFRTTDSGRTWKSTTIPVQGVQSIHFIDARNGWLLDSEGSYAGGNAPAVHQSTDGGETWVKISSTEPLRGYKRAVTFLDVMTGWVTGTYVGNLYVTRDGGRTWQQQKLPAPSGVPAHWWLTTTMAPIFFTARDAVIPTYYINDDPDAGPLGYVLVFYATANGGMSWTPRTPVPAQRPGALSFVDSNHGWVVDGGKLYVTSDGGRQWSAVQPAGSFADIRQLDFISPQVGWAVSRISPYLQKTVDGGRTWNPVQYMIAR